MNRVHVVAAVAALSLTSGVLLLASMQQPTLPYHPAPIRLPDRIAGIPAPEDLVLIREGETFTVPADRLFVVTAISRDDPTFWNPFPGGGVSPAGESHLTVRFDSTPTLAVALTGNLRLEDTVAIPPGVVATAGTTVSVEERSRSGNYPFIQYNPSAVRALLHGYLFDKSKPALTIKGIPSPTSMLRIEEGTPFIVPEGKRLVVTGLGFDAIPFVTSWDTETLPPPPACPPECGINCASVLYFSLPAPSRLSLVIDGEVVTHLYRFSAPVTDRVALPVVYVAQSQSTVTAVEESPNDPPLDSCGAPTAEFGYLAGTSSKVVVLGYLSDE